MFGLFGARAVVGVIGPALAQHHRQALGTSIDLNEPPMLICTDTQRHEEVGSQHLSPANCREWSPTGRFGFSGEKIAHPLLSRHGQADHQLPNRQGVVDEESRWLPEATAGTIKLQYSLAYRTEGIDVAGGSGSKATDASMEPDQQTVLDQPLQHPSTGADRRDAAGVAFLAEVQRFDLACTHQTQIGYLAHDGQIAIRQVISQTSQLRGADANLAHNVSPFLPFGAAKVQSAGVGGIEIDVSTG